MNLPSIPSHLCTSHSAAPGNKQSARQDDVRTREEGGGGWGGAGRHSGQDAKQQRRPTLAFVLGSTVWYAAM